MGRFLPPDHDAGDANTVGGYRAVHARPAAFEGKDGSAYSVEVVVDETGDPTQPYAGYLLFVRWEYAEQVVAGHIETEYLHFGSTPESVRDALGAMRLNQAKSILDALITANARKERPWYDVMHDENDDEDDDDDVGGDTENDGGA